MHRRPRPSLLLVRTMHGSGDDWDDWLGKSEEEHILWERLGSKSPLFYLLPLVQTGKRAFRQVPRHSKKKRPAANIHHPPEWPMGASDNHQDHRQWR